MRTQMKRWLIAAALAVPVPALAACPIPDGSSAGCPLYTTGTTSATTAPTNSQPTETTTAIGTGSTQFGTPGSFKSLTIQAQGQAMCVTFGSGTPSAPANNTCAVGMILVAGQFYSYGPTAVPNSQGKAAAAATGGSLWESVQ